MISLLWIANIVVTVLIADRKKLSTAGYFIFSLFFGPIALIVALLSKSNAEDAIRETGVFTLEEAKEHLFNMKRDLKYLKEKADFLESKISVLSGDEAKVEVADKQFIDEQRKTIKEEHSYDKDDIKPSFERQYEKKTQTTKQEKAPSGGIDIEINFGRNWLNKIGIIIFTLGMGFLISYTFKYFGPFFKIAFGYLVSPEKRV